MNPINLIPRRRLEARLARRRIRSWTLFGGLYAAAVATTCMALRFSVSASPPGFYSEMDHVSARAAEIARDSHKVSHDTAMLQARLDAARTVGYHPDWSLLLNALADRRGEETVLESVEITPTQVEGPRAAPPAAPHPPTPGTPADKARKPEPEPVMLDGFAVHITGLTRRAGQPFAFARELERLGVLDQVRIKDTRTERLGTIEVVRFNLNAVVSDRPGGGPR